MAEYPSPTLRHPKVVPIETQPPPVAVPSYPKWVGPAQLRSSTLASSFENERPTRRCTPVTVTVPANATASDRALLTMLGGPNAGQVFPLEQDETFLGRGGDADVCIDE